MNFLNYSKQSFEWFYYGTRALYYLTLGRYTNYDEYIKHVIAWEIIFEGKHQELLEPVE